VKTSLAQRTVAECLGTAFLLAAVVGSGIMAAKLQRQRRVGASLQHAADGRDPHGAHSRIRSGVGRAF
jgi:glycerol uptake facilitator-like aquaporin